MLSLNIPVALRRKEREGCTQAEALISEGKVEALVIDGSDTLWKDSFAEDYGKYHLKQSFLRAHFNTFRKGLAAKKQIKEMAKREGEAAALSAVYAVLVENGLGNQEDMKKRAKKFLRKNEIREVAALLRKAREKDIPIVLVTIEGSTIANAAEERYGIDCILSNRDVFAADKMLAMMEVRMSNGEEKATAALCALEALHCRIERSMVVGDSIRLDGPLLRKAGSRVASPYATKQVEGIEGILLLRK